MKINFNNILLLVISITLTTYCQITGFKYSDWPPQNFMAHMSVNYTDNNNIRKSMDIKWFNKLEEPRNVFEIYKNDTILVQRITFGKKNIIQEIPGRHKKRFLALHHFREYILESILQLEDLRLLTIPSFGLLKNGEYLRKSESYEKIEAVNGSLKIYSNHKKHSKTISMKEIENFGGFPVPRKALIQDAKYKWKKAILRIDDIRFADANPIVVPIPGSF